MKRKNIQFICLIIFISLSVLTKSQLAQGKPKFLGNIMGANIPNDFKTYWNQITLEYLGKWAHVENSPGAYSWSFINQTYKYAKQNGFIYKQHNFIWRVSDPGWLQNLPDSQKLYQIQNWIKTFCSNFTPDLIDVVNQPLHQKPLYKDLLGGDTNWAWVVKSFEWARKYCPNSKLLLNDYSIISFEQSTTKYLQIINILKAKGYIDGIGIQCHGLEGAGNTPMLKNLFKLAQTGLDIYVSELDLGASDDQQQFKLYKRIFPLLYEHPAVKGVTLWGYNNNEMSTANAGLVNGTGAANQRAAMTWLKNQYFNSAVNKEPHAFYTYTKSGSSITFDSSKSWDTDGTISTYSWNFGNGQTSNLQNPSISYNSKGKFTVTLTITDNQNAANTFLDYLQVTTDAVDISKPIAFGREKFIGTTIKFDKLDTSLNWDRYWNQVTPEYLGKWTSTQVTQDSMTWAGLDFAYNYAKQRGILFKGHTLVWGEQIPSWVGNQANQVEQWIQLYCQRYPDFQLLDVVNEPTHIVPSYANSIGGSGATGWDWVIWAFTKARAYCPNAKLLINDFYILSGAYNKLNEYISIIKLLNDRGLIDGIGCQSHHLQYEADSTILDNLNKLHSNFTNLPIYISELDLQMDEAPQLARMKTLFPLLYEHPGVKGITFWNYIKGQTADNAWLYDPSATSSSSSCPVITLLSNQALVKNTWRDFTVSITQSGYVRARFANDGAANSQTMQVDYAIIDGVKYQAQDQYTNTAVWNGQQCGSHFNQVMHCPGYIQFPIGTQSATIRARAVQGGQQQLTIQILTNCSSSDQSGSTLPQQRAALQWLKYTYLPQAASNKPTAAFNTSINSLVVLFDGTSSTDYSGTISSWNWNFGDSQTGFGSTISHQYTSYGNYNVALTVTDNNGNQDNITKTISVLKPNIGPTANFTIVSVNDLIVQVDGSSSTDSDGSISTYTWSFGDGQTGTNSATNSHTYSIGGTYTINLTVTDNQGAKSSFQANVTVKAACGTGTVDWTKPIAFGRQKFIGTTIKFETLDSSLNWDRYWNQVTPEYLGKWTSTQSSQDVMTWAGLDFAYNYAKQRGILFKGHTLIWGEQIPGWVGSQANQVEQWIQLYCQRYPDYHLLDVVNEPTHIVPSYANSIGGSGATGWDWVIWAFTKARAYCPNAKLLINDFYILSGSYNKLTDYISIIKLLNDRGLIDGIGCQSHHLQYEADSTILDNLNKLHSNFTNLPIYISELDLQMDEAPQLARMKTLFPLFYEHPGVKGITFWNYIKGQTADNAWLYDPSATSSSSSCPTKSILSNQGLIKNTFKQYTATVTQPGIVRARFANDGSPGSQTMEVDYAIIDGVKYQAQDMVVNTAVWSGVCGGTKSQLMHCPGYIQFPYVATQSVVISARAVDGGNQQLTIEIVQNCNTGSIQNLPQERAALQWLKYTYLPQAASGQFSASFNTTISQLNVNFDGTGSTDSCGTITSWNWVFGDGQTGAGSIVPHTYTTSGNYVVTLNVTDNNTKSAIITKQISVVKANVPPKADFVVQSVDGDTVQVNASASSDPDGTISSYSWNFGDGQTGTNQVVNSHVYSTSGDYNITLTVTDDKGATSTIKILVTVTVPPNINPIANFTIISTDGLTINVNGSNSTDPDGSIKQYKWDWGDGNVQAGASILSHTYSKSANYTITLTVTDSVGATNSTTISNIEMKSPNTPPVANFTYNVTLLNVTFNATSSTDDSGIASYDWSFGDNTPNGNTSIANHTYSQPGTYSVKLTVSDQPGLTNNKTLILTVKDNQPPACSFSCSPSYQSVICSSSSTDDDTITGFDWIWGDGKTSSGSANVNHDYTAASQYTVKLTVTDQYSAKTTCNQTITTTNAPSTNQPPQCGAGVSWIENNNIAHLWCWANDYYQQPVDKFNWNFGDGSYSSQSNTTHQYASSGTYFIILMVTDIRGLTTTCQTQATINIPTPPPPVAPFSNWGFDLDPANNVKTWSSPYTTDGTTINSALWDWGDGTTSTDAQPTHTYLKSGSYSITNTVTNSKGVKGNSTKTVSINLSANPPTGGLGLSWIQNNRLAHYNCWASSNIASSTITYEWDFGDGSPKSASPCSSNPSHTYTKKGTFTTTLKISDTRGVSTSLTTNVVISK